MTSFEKSEVRRLYRTGKSTVELAALFNTYPNAIRRLLKSSGEKLRGMSEAQCLSLKNGVRINPTKGTIRPQTIRDRISATKRKKYWEKLNDEARQRIYSNAMNESGGLFPQFLWNCLMQLGYGVLLEADNTRIQVFSRKAYIYFDSDYTIENNYSNFVVVPKQHNVKNYAECFLRVAAILETKLKPNSLFIIEE